MTRNFQIESEMADGRMRSIYVPRGKGDRFHLNILMRNKEELEKVLEIEGRAQGEKLMLCIDYDDVNVVRPLTAGTTEIVCG